MGAATGARAIGPHALAAATSLLVLAASGCTAQRVRPEVRDLGAAIGSRRGELVPGRYRAHLLNPGRGYEPCDCCLPGPWPATPELYERSHGPRPIGPLELLPYEPGDLRRAGRLEVYVAPALAAALHPRWLGSWSWRPRPVVVELRANERGLPIVTAIDHLPPSVPEPPPLDAAPRGRATPTASPTLYARSFLRPIGRYLYSASFVETPGGFPPGTPVELVDYAADGIALRIDGRRYTLLPLVDRFDPHPTGRERVLDAFLARSLQDVPAPSARFAAAVRAGRVELGMSRAEVLAALGPPLHPGWRGAALEEAVRWSYPTDWLTWLVAPGTAGRTLTFDPRGELTAIE